jgi:AraC-like DNA-binding protein
LRALEQYLVANLAGATLERAARTLGMATRSLQRQLNAARASFRGELERTRIDAARRRLAESDDKLEVIADELGFASPTHFSARFRALTGELPSDYRARSRGA